MKNDGFALACKLFGLALIDIRESAYRGGDKAIYGLADLFHNVPASVELFHQSEPDKVLNGIIEMAKNRGYVRWLLNAASHIDFTHPDIEELRRSYKAPDKAP